ncbi:MAG: hypothetical protein IJK46_11705 [Prevotella sp.]|nr:hypothetical protein [Prevotella sp.]
MEKAIGGYFELELPNREEYHKNALRLNSGKNCLEYILRCRKYRKVYIPYYTCDVILKPFQKLGIAYQFYHINLNFEIADDIRLEECEALLYTNYYGLKQGYVDELASNYGKQLIVDNTQAFFAKPVEGIDTFYTCRKFFGVSDGAYLYSDAEQPIKDLKQGVSYNRIEHLIKRIDLSPEEGFNDFRQADESLAEEKIMLMSHFTQRVMQSIDYKAIIKQRIGNFQQLHASLGESNLLQVELDNASVPMIYPYMTERKNLRNNLIYSKVFVARYWPNVLEWTDKGSVDYNLAENTIPLPVDQRCGNNEISKIINIIKI